MANSGLAGDASRGYRTSSPGAPARGDVYTMEEAARFKGVSYHTVSRAVRSGKLPARRLGRMALIALDDLRSWAPMRQRAPKIYAQRQPDPEAQPALLDLASGERVELARRLSRFYQTIHVAAAYRDFPEFCAILCERFAKAMKLRRVSLWSIDEDLQRAHRLARFGPPLSNAADSHPLSDFPELHALVKRSPLIVVDDIHTLGLSGPSVSTDRVRALMIAPLRVGDRLLGVFFADWNGEMLAFGEAQLSLAQIVANQAALALDFARLRAAEAQRRNQLAAILENVGAGVTAVDDEGRLILTNAAHRELIQVEESESGIGQPLAEIGPTVRRFEFDGRPIPLDQIPVFRALQGERIRDRQYLIERPDGKRIALSVNAQPIWNDRAIAGAVSVGRDISADRQRDERERSQLRRVEAAVDRAKAVADVSLAVNVGIDLPTVLQTAITRLTDLLGGRSGSIFFHQADGQMAGQIGYRIADPSVATSSPELLTLPATLAALARRETVVLTYAQASEGERSFFDRLEARSALIAPLVAGGELIGAAYVNYVDEQHIPSRDDLDFAAALAAQCAVAIEKVRLLDQREMANRRLNAVIEQLAHAVIIADAPSGRILLANQAALRLWGRATLTQADTVLDLPMEALDGGSLVAGDRPFPIILTLGGEIRDQPVVVTGDDGRRNRTTSIAAVEDGSGRAIGIVCISEDAKQVPA